ncbi:hypothetical protein LCGC14_0876950 [marine sediment metagenome]|uniref:Uncharacterized protein n=1 Tax=marine sediment metagenome TaxID=412755 RepID=A0A0F9PNL7_9ZZZZ
MPGRLPRLPGVVASIDTAGEGFVVVPIITPGNLVTMLISSGVNATWVFQFILPVRITFTEIVTEITTGGASGKKYGVGFYDKDKNLIIETGALDAEAVAINSTNVTSTTLEPGVYWQAQTTDDAATQARGLASAVVDVWDLANKNNTRSGTGNASSAGVLPATIGTITKSTIRFPVAILLEP